MVNYKKLQYGMIYRDMSNNEKEVVYIGCNCCKQESYLFFIRPFLTKTIIYSKLKLRNLISTGNYENIDDSSSDEDDDYNDYDD